MSAFKKICYVSSNRSDYAKVKRLLVMLNEDKDIDLVFIASGSMANERFGKFVEDVKKDGINVDYSVNCCLDDDTQKAMVKSSALQIYELTEIFDREKPDLGIIVGDRFDILPAAYALTMLNIPVAHIQGGEKTGTIDDMIRDTITKMSHIHFAATDFAHDRIIDMEEDPKHVYNVGCPSVDFIKRLDVEFDLERIKPYCKEEIELSPDDDYFMVMVHPNVTDPDDVDINEVMTAVDKFPNKKVFFYPNNDPFHQDIISVIGRKEGIIKFRHVPMDVFIMMLANCKCLIGNSSCGIRESCIFGIPTVDIGKRQNNREHGDNVANTICRADQIETSIDWISQKTFKPTSYYGDGETSERIVDIIKGYKELIYKNVRTR